MSFNPYFPIMILEDNPDDRNTIERELQHIEHRLALDFQTSGIKAMASLLSKKNTAVQALPKVIILDIFLPDISGIEFLEKLRADERLRSIPVIVLTGSKNPQDMMDAFNDNVSNYVIKPTRLEELRDALRKIISFLSICEFV